MKEYDVAFEAWLGQVQVNVGFAGSLLEFFETVACYDPYYAFDSEDTTEQFAEQVQRGQNERRNQS